MFIKCPEKMNLIPRFYKTYLVYKRTKDLFHIKAILPNQLLCLNQHYVNKNPCHSFKTAYRSLKNFSFFPIIYAKILTKEQMAELQSEKEFMIQQVSEDEVNDFISKESGQDRIRSMFSKDIRGELSNELKFIWPTTARSTVLAFLMFYLLKFKELREKFVRENRGTTFYSNFMAGRKIRDTVNLGAMRHGFKWGGRIFSLVFTFLMISQSIAVYRNKSSPWEYIAAFGLTGSLNRFYLGPKGMLSGYLLGTVLGSPIAIVTYGILKANGCTQEENHFKAVREILAYQKKLRGEVTLPPKEGVKVMETLPSEEGSKVIETTLPSGAGVMVTEISPTVKGSNSSEK